MFSLKSQTAKINSGYFRGRYSGLVQRVLLFLLVLPFIKTHVSNIRLDKTCSGVPICLLTFGW